MEAPDAELQSRWATWLLERNRRGTRGLLGIVLTLYPSFGILDYLTAPRDWLWLLYSTRAVITLVTLAMFKVIGSAFFERHQYTISSAYIVLISYGISVMTVFMGGLSSPYYAGLSLVVVATGLLYVWPLKVVIVTHATIVLSFVFLNVAFNQPFDWLTAVSNQFFLVSMAIIAGTGQFVSYRSLREQVRNQLLVESTTKHLEQAHGELKRLDRFKSEFFANVTHELKTPLTMMLAPLELMIEGQLGPLSEAQRSTLISIQKNGIKLRRLIGDLLDLSKLEESKLRLRVAEHDLVEYVRGLVAQAEPLAQRKALKLSFESNVQQCMIWCDLERLERVLVNLLSNATKFTQPDGRVWVTLEDRGAEVLLEVSDTGIGFPPGMAERIFDRFFQVDMAGTRRYGGTGIGLALAKELVELHGGKIWARGELGEGATISVLLPKDREHFKPEVLDRRSTRSDYPYGSRSSDRGVGEWRTDDEERYRLIDIDQATDQRIVERDADEKFRPHSVLVVEDTPDVIRMIRLALHHEFRVLAAPDGKKGLELARKHQPTIIITDLMMPELDGLELTRRLRDDPATAHIPIIMLTARDDLEDRVAGHDVGVNAYLGKPFSTRELVAVVRSQLTQRESTADLLMNQKLDSLQTIAGGLAHEIKNPLNYIQSAVTCIRRDAERIAQARSDEGPKNAEELDQVLARLRRMFDTAESGVRRIAATVDLMLRYSREGYTKTLQPYDAYAAVHDVMKVLLPSVDYPVSVVTELEGDGTIECVPEEFNQVLTNLLENALHAVPNDGTGVITVRGVNQAGLLTLSVRDNGPGIPPEEQVKVFTAFYTTKPGAKGTGLGLTIVRRVVDALGGSVYVKSELGSGAEFTLRVPSLRGRRALRAVPSRALEEVAK